MSKLLEQIDAKQTEYNDLTEQLETIEGQRTEVGLELIALQNQREPFKVQLRRDQRLIIEYVNEIPAQRGEPVTVSQQ